MTSRSAPQTPHRPAPATTSFLQVPCPATPALRGLQVVVIGSDEPAGARVGVWCPRTVAEHVATVADAVSVLTDARRHSGGRAGDPSRPGRRTVGLNAAGAGRRLRADLVISVSARPPAAAAAAWLARRAGAPLVTVIAPTGPADGRRARLAAAWERYSLRHSAQVAVTGEEIRPLLRAWVDPERLHLLPAGPRTVPTPLSRAAARSRLGWRPDRFVAVHAGSLGHRQDGATLVEAARLLEQLCPEGAPGPGGPEVVLVAEGSQRAALERQAVGVSTLRFLDPDDGALSLVLAAADVLLLAERSADCLADGLGAGRAVLAAAPRDGAMARELLRSGGGVRVDPGDPLALARALLDLRDAAGRCTALGRAGRRYARAHLGREASLRRLDAVIEAALDVTEVRPCGRPPRLERSGAGPHRSVLAGGTL